MNELIDKVMDYGLSHDEAVELIELIADWTGGNLPEDWCKTYRRNIREVKK